jgi:O-antigen ligase
MVVIAVDLRGWRDLPLSSLAVPLAGSVLGGMVFIATTRLNILPGDPLIIGYFDGSGSALRQGLFLLGVAIMLAVGRPFSDPGQLVRLPLTLIALLAWCALSIGWSDAADIATRRLLLTMIVIWLCFRTVDQLGHRLAMDVVLYVCIGLLFANLVAVASFTDAVHHNQGELKDSSIVGAWRGILPEKNGAGLLSAITVLLLLFGVGRLRPMMRCAVIVAATVFLLGSHSKTSMAFAGSAALLGGVFHFYDRRLRILLLPMTMIGLPVCVYASVAYLPGYFQTLASSLDAFTGRIQIWRIMLDYIKDHPWTGSGFASVWNVGPISPIYRYSNVPWVTKAVAEGHNGYLDLWMQIGLPGLVLAIVALLVVPVMKLLSMRSKVGGRAGLQLALILFNVGHNCMESSFLSTDQFGEMMLMLSIACVDNMRRNRRGSLFRASAVTAPTRWHRVPDRTIDQVGAR